MNSPSFFSLTPRCVVSFHRGGWNGCACGHGGDHRFTVYGASHYKSSFCDPATGSCACAGLYDSDKSCAEKLNPLIYYMVGSCDVVTCSKLSLVGECRSNSC